MVEGESSADRVPYYLASHAQKAQKNNGPAYDLTTETKVKGTIEEVRLPSKGNSKDVAHLLLKSGSETFDVYLCPKAFLDDMGCELQQG